jgi:hypothetical protein
VNDIVLFQSKPANRPGSRRYAFNVPHAIGEDLEATGVREFTVEVTDAGILYRPLRRVPITFATAPGESPAQPVESGASAPKRTRRAPVRHPKE